jgi:ATP-dependent Clp protease ATP-binding subunit ClpC
MSQWGPPAEGADPESTLTPRTVNEATIAEIVAEHKHLPLEQLTSTEQEQLLKLEERLKARVIGQDQAVSALARFVRLARTGLRDPNKPGGVFLFVGPTGVGKTELAKALANALFGADDQLTRFDMSEFMEPHSVAKLIGSPPGYVGYQEEGQLVRVLRRKPYSVVLIDEIEKAAANIFDLFLQLFDEGRLTDEHGQQVDGRHAMYIMTSNVGSELVGRRRMGFGVSAADDDRFQGEVRDRLRQTFRPEFLNRIDEILIFNKLTPENIRAIALQQIDTLRARLQEEHGIDLQVEPDAVDLICAEGFVENMGARALQRTVVQRLAAPLSELLLGGTEGVIIARADDQQIIFEMGEPPDSENTIRGD